MSAIYHIHPNYTSTTVWHSKSRLHPALCRTSSIKVDKKHERHVRFEEIRDWLQGMGLGCPVYKFSRHDKHVENGVLLRRGVHGWRGRLRANYKGLRDFRATCEIYNNHKRLGFNTPEEAWAVDPVVEGGVNLFDYKLSKGYAV